MEISIYNETEEKIDDELKIMHDVLVHGIDKLKVGDVLLIDKGQVKINSIENKEKRVNSEYVSEIKTIWASSLEIPARIGLSIDFHGKVKSYKLDVDRDFEINTNDIIKIENYILKVHIIKTDNKKITTGSAKADTIKRVYTKTINLKTYDYNLTENIVKIKSDYEQ